MAELTANNGRIVFSAAALRGARRLVQQPSLAPAGLREATAHLQEAIATIVLPQGAFAVLAARKVAQRPMGPGRLKKQAAPFQRRPAASIGKIDKLTADQAVARDWQIRRRA